jgi:hypothetical protein
MMPQIDWNLQQDHKESKKLNEIITAQAKRLQKNLLEAKDDEDKYAAVFQYYRKYYTLTLTKINQEAGINRSPTRDIILDYPWKDLQMDRFFCLKIWEKINH